MPNPTREIIPLNQILFSTFAQRPEDGDPDVDVYGVPGRGPPLRIQPLRQPGLPPTEP